jgi:hypothetical protein
MVATEAPTAYPATKSPIAYAGTGNSKNSATNAIVAVMEKWPFPTNAVEIIDFAIWPGLNSGYLRPIFSDERI